MKTFNRLVPALSAVVIFVLMERIIQSPRQIYWLSFVIIAFLILAIWQLTDRRLLSKRFWQFVTTPSLLMLSGMLFLVFLEGVYAVHIFIVIIALAIWTYLEVSYLWLHFRAKYQPHSLENISTHLNLLTTFLITSGLLSLKVFFGLSIWPLLLIFAIISALLTNEMIWASDSTFKFGWPYIAVITLAVVELFLAVSYLPASIYVQGLVVTLGYYVMTGITRNWLLGIKDVKVVKRYLFISSICLFIILATAKWL